MRRIKETYKYFNVNVDTKRGETRKETQKMTNEIIRDVTEARIGMTIYTPRFCTVRIDAIFSTYAAARRAGFNEDSHYGMCDNCGRFLPEDLPIRIVGRMIGENRMEFAVCPRRD